jgi:hypothetical protein
VICNNLRKKFCHNYSARSNGLAVQRLGCRLFRTADNMVIRIRERKSVSVDGEYLTVWFDWGVLQGVTVESGQLMNGSCKGQINSTYAKGIYKY